MNSYLPDIGIVGGGLAGLAAATRLQDAGLKPLVIEKSDRVGGRVRTEEIDGFLIDEGFQVYLSAYPEAGKLLDLEELELQHFLPGALVYHSGSMHRVMDIFRQPNELISSATAKIGSIKDKCLIALLKKRLHNKSIQQIAASEDLTTQQWLQNFGFSDTMIDRFFRPFYGGIFLENDLRTSSQMFEFTFSTFSKGHASLPAKGMAEIPRQLAGRLPKQAIQLNTGVTQLSDKNISLDSGETMTFQSVIVATDGTTASKLVPDVDPPSHWRSVTNLYFTAPESPINEPIIGLNGSGEGIVSNVSVLTNVAKGYSSDDRPLISVTILGEPSPSTELISTVQTELQNWFGDTSDWQHLKTCSIRKALPEQAPKAGAFSGNQFQTSNGVFVCGDHCASASIEGAITSGQQAADAVIEKISAQS